MSIIILLLRCFVKWNMLIVFSFLVPLVADNWNKSKEDPEFVSRYQQITGHPDTSFDDNVPGE